MIKKVLDILRIALIGGENTMELNSQEVLTVLREAERQTVVGLVFNELGRTQVSIGHENVFNYVGLTQQIEQQNRKQNEVLKELGVLSKNHGIRYAVVKGQIAGLNYPEPMLRQSGDIDLYCDEENFLKVKLFIEKEWGVTFEGNEEEHHHIEFEYKGIPIELHHKLIKLYSKRRDEYWRKLCQQPYVKVDIDGVEVSTLSPTLHTLYIFLHLYHHLLELGVGLRQFCDWAMMVHESKINYEELRMHLKVLGMERAYRACGAVLVDGLGITEEELGYGLTKKDRSYGKKILDVVAYRGNMGYYEGETMKESSRLNVKAVAVKGAHYLKFMPLAPGFTTRWLISEVKRKTLKRLKV